MNFILQRVYYTKNYRICQAEMNKLLATRKITQYTDTRLATILQFELWAACLECQSA